ncbi:MAG: hypothetical protein AB8B64_22470 [Granulosicoccus sp.]
MSKDPFHKVVGVVFVMCAVSTQVNAQSQTAELIDVTDTFNWSTPSPDPTGVIYIPGANGLFVADSEVNETAVFTGSNVFQTQLDGSLLDTFSTLDFTDEPAGITINPANGHLFISTDNSPRGVYEIDPGVDGIYDNADDNISFFSSTDFGSEDPEGISYNPLDGRLYIVDGEANLVHVVDPGVNDVFDGVAPEGDDTAFAFTTGNLGVVDPEGVAFDETTNGLYIIGEPVDQLLHVSTTGQFIRLIELDSSLLFKPAGLALAPSSLANGGQSLFLVDRGVDNDSNPDENDGRLFEFALPPLPGNDPPVVTITAPVSGQGVSASSTVTFTGVANDTEEGDLSAGLIWQSDLDGLIGSGSSFTTSTLSSGQHSITASVVDSTLAQSFMSVTLNVFPAGRVIVERRIASGADDAEERGGSGNTWLSSDDLEMALDRSTEQIIALRFNSLQIPTGAVVEEAFIQFKVEESQTEATRLEIRGQASDNAEPIVSQKNNLSNRPTTSAASIWNPLPWPNKGESGVAQKSSDLTAVIQEVVDRPGWSAGNSMAFIITGDGQGRRTAESFDGDAEGAAMLFIQYQELAAAPELSIISPSDGDSFANGTPVVLSATSSDVEDGDLSASIVWESAVDGALGTGASVVANELSAGTQLITATVVNSAGRATSAGVSVTIEAASNSAPSVIISSPADGTRVLDGVPVTLTASATDAEDGNLSALIFWQSDLDGNLGVGASIDANSLSIGTHQISASVSDSGGLSSITEILLVVESLVNSAPVLTITSPANATRIDEGTALTLSASALDDEDGNLSATVTWSSDLDGPLGTGSPSALLSVGMHTLTASVSDTGGLSVTRSVTVEVGDIGGGDVTVRVRVSADTDDAEERGTRGRMSLSSRDLELVIDRGTNNAVGMRFRNLQIPKDAGIVSAYIQFQVDEVTSELTILDITAQESDDTSTFTSNRFDISLRPRTALSVDWVPSRWLDRGDAGVAQQTTDLSALVQRIVNRDNWSPGNSMVFLVDGDGTRTAESFEGDQEGAPQLVITYTLDNLAPVVSTSNDQVVGFGETALISATVSDDGRPSDSGALETEWIVAEGAGLASFGDVSSLSTTVDFDTVGNYVLVLKASDGQLTAYDEVSVTVEPSAQNLAPAVSAGPDRLAIVGETVFLAGTITDDGLPGADIDENISWVQLSGPADAGIGSAGSAGTNVQFSEVGTYTFELSAFDGELSSSDEVEVTVASSTGSASISAQIIDDDDDGEESSSGAVDLSSSDLELVEERSVQVVGMRFRSIAIPNASTITNAYIQFTVDEVDGDAASLIIQAESADDSAAFTTVDESLSSRARTQSLVSWSPPAWEVIRQSSSDQATPDLSSVIQEIVDRPGWVSGNALSILMTGSGTRTAESFDGSANAAPRLVIEFQISE